MFINLGHTILHIFTSKYRAIAASYKVAATKKKNL